jgi:2-keto-3-deoxy-L-rhamnonate aldolase RhmA
MTANELSTAMRCAQHVYGTLIVSTSPKWPEAVRGPGLDFVYIDTEHQPPFTPLRSPQRRPQAPHPKSKFLAAAIDNACVGQRVSEFKG